MRGPSGIASVPHRSRRFLECVRQARRSRGATGDMAQADHHQFEGGHYRDALLTIATHPERVLRDSNSTRAVQPEETAIDGLLPSRCGRGHKANELGGQQALAEPDALPQVEQAETRPATGRAVNEPRQNEVPLYVRLQNHPANPNAIQQRALGPGQIVVASRLHGATHDRSEHKGVGIAVATHLARRVLRGRADRKPVDVAHARVDANVVRNTAPEEVQQRDLGGSGVAKDLGKRKAQATRHSQEMGHRDCSARIVPALPLGHGGGLL